MAHVTQSDTAVSDSRRFGRVAIVHDWLTTYAGSERVLEQIIQIWPDADLFSIVDFFPDEHRAALGGKHAKTSFIQHLPRARTAFRTYLPLMPLAVEQFDLSAYDLVISSSHAVAKGVITGPDQVHVSYVHSPIRYAWDLQHQYLIQAGVTKGPKSWLARSVLHYMRIWDHRTAHGVDAFIANSDFIGRRIRKIYGVGSTVVYPPVDVDRFDIGTHREDFYLIASRMVPYKRIPLIVEAFASLPNRRLIVVGDGPDFKRVKALAGSNVTLLGYQPTHVLIDLMRRARAFVFAAEEDFGITIVEAQACGAPVIAYGRGGALETVIESHDPNYGTGLFFMRQSVPAIVDAIMRFEAREPMRPEVCRGNAVRFTAERFRAEFLRVVDDAICEARGRSVAAGS
ncbi:glycosyl transferase family 1 [Burkholderia ubonensis]|uniref:glycosyltransferase family 4 protein n=1 Tax=Burkholderia ubonensis TaxID=101571 RepID=UPI00016A329E|nr:glycosyltransferase family 4 protein [Burkholderia ubonensis]KWE44651.1 glycosyl transferase family 1 [Burkholderia ubonensis]KWE65147.1 glycosyl transferase family 1 [Burkholderia ubonensis]KWE67070.1 glycosyl transferase family 1 [Burkholderia ubonensis]